MKFNEGDTVRIVRKNYKLRGFETFVLEDKKPFGVEIKLPDNINLIFDTKHLVKSRILLLEIYNYQWIF